VDLHKRHNALRDLLEIIDTRAVVDHDLIDPLNPRDVDRLIHDGLVHNDNGWPDRSQKWRRSTKTNVFGA